MRNRLASISPTVSIKNRRKIYEEGGGGKRKREREREREGTCES